jgi:hypothetical protein
MNGRGQKYAQNSDRIRQVGISRRKMGNNIKMYRRHTLEFHVVYCMYLAQDRDKW